MMPDASGAVGGGEHGEGEGRDEGEPHICFVGVRTVRSEGLQAVRDGGEDTTGDEGVEKEEGIRIATRTGCCRQKGRSYNSSQG